MTSHLRCERCNQPSKYSMPADTVSFLCGTCAMMSADLKNFQEKDRRAQVTPEMVKSVRKSVKFTQQNFDDWLGLPVNHTNKVENGHEIPCENLFNFVRDFQDGKVTKVPYTKRSQTIKKRRKKRK